MKHLKIQFCFKNSRYVHSAITGQLYTGSEIYLHPSKLPAKVELALGLCHNPYRLPTRSASVESTDSFSANKNIADRIIHICRINFWLATRYASWQKPIHPDASDAIAAFREIIGTKKQKELCLPRALYTAKTSLRFKEHGVVLIGVFLPSRAMHAWVIEDGRLADPYDTEWLQHRPVAALY